MQLEFAYMLRGLLNRLAQESECAPVRRVFQLVDVEEPPACAEADVGTSVAFRLAALFRKNDLAVQYPDPERIAQILCESYQPTVRLFELRTSGLGHINANSTQLFSAGFLKQVFSQGVAPLFSADSMFGECEPIAVDPLVEPDWQYQISRARNDDDCRKFLESRKDPWSFNDRLLFLAMQGDPELDTRPYNQGLAGRQNVPWYVAKYSSDWRSCASRFSEKTKYTDEQLTTVWLKAAESKLRYPWTSGCFLASTLEFLCTFRSHSVLTPVPRRPVAVVAATLAAIRSFYTFYNHPDTRCGDFDSSLSETIAHAISLMGETVEEALGRLRLSERSLRK